MAQPGEYRVGDLIGKGAMGAVYLGEFLGEGGFSRQVALKVLNPERSDIGQLAKRLRDEARLLGLLRHRAIVHVDGLVHLDGRWTVVMEYIDGVDLRHVIGEGPIPPGPALEIIGEVAAALTAAYWTRTKSGEPLRLLHRDIKPSNVLLTPAGEVKVVDFGVARADYMVREAETAGHRFGSLGYMSPERLEYRDGPEGDVYALGAVLYELLAGRPLGRTSVQPARHSRIMRDAMQYLHRTKPGMSTSMLGFLSLMLGYEPSGRPSAREVDTRCREFRGKIGGVWLREWAEATIPSMRKGVAPEVSGSLGDRVNTDEFHQPPDESEDTLDSLGPPEAELVETSGPILSIPDKVVSPTPDLATPRFPIKSTPVPAARRDTPRPADAWSSPVPVSRSSPVPRSGRSTPPGPRSGRSTPAEPGWASGSTDPTPNTYEPPTVPPSLKSLVPSPSRVHAALGLQDGESLPSDTTSMLRRLEGEPGSRKPRRTFVVVGVVLLIPAVAALVLLLLWNM